MVSPHEWLQIHQAFRCGSPDGRTRCHPDRALRTDESKRANGRLCPTANGHVFNVTVHQIGEVAGTYIQHTACIDIFRHPPPPPPPPYIKHASHRRRAGCAARNSCYTYPTAKLAPANFSAIARKVVSTNYGHLKRARAIATLSPLRRTPMPAQHPTCVRMIQCAHMRH